LQLKTGSTQYYTEIAARNFKVAIESFEYQINGAWVLLTRQQYNYFDYSTTVTLPVTARLTSVLGEQQTVTLSSGDYANIVEAGFLVTNFQFTGSGSTGGSTTKPPTAPVTPPVTPTKPPTAPTTPPTAPTKPPTAPTTPPTTPTKPPTAPVTPPVTSTNPKCTYGSSTNVWWIEFNCDQQPTNGVTVTCADNSQYSCTLASWGTYQCQVTGSTGCNTPRKAVVSGQCCPLDSTSVCSSAEIVDESTSGSQNINLPIGAIIGIVAAIIVILVVLVVIVVMKLRTPVMEQV